VTRLEEMIVQQLNYAPSGRMLWRAASRFASELDYWTK